MTLPVMLHSGMTGAPQATHANGTITSLLTACLVNGFNTQSVVSATASGGVVTFNFASAPGFSALDTVQIAGASNATVNGKFRVQSAASNQVLVAIPGVPDGAVGGTITLKFAPLGWTRPYSGTNIAAYRQGGAATHKRFLRVRDSAYLTDPDGTARWRVRGYENMTGINSGTGPFPTTAQESGDGCRYLGPQGGSSTANSDPRPWVLVGTPRAFYFMVAHQWDNGGDPSYGLQHPKDVTEAGGNVAVFLGEFTGLTKPADVYAYGVPSNYSYPLGHGSNLYVPRVAAGTGTGTVGNAIGGLANGNGTCFGAPYPSPANGGLTLGAPMVAVEHFAQTMRGSFPGLLTTFENPIANNAIRAGTVLDAIDGVTGRVVLMDSSATSNPSAFFLALDEDWGDL